MLIIIERSTQLYLLVGWYASVPANWRQFHCTRKMTISGVSFLDSCCPRSNTSEDAILNQQVPVMQSKRSRADSSEWRRHGWSANSALGLTSVLPSPDYQLFTAFGCLWHRGQAALWRLKGQTSWGCKWAWNQSNWVEILALPPATLWPATPQESSEPRFPHLYIWNINNIYLMGLIKD